MKSCVNIKDKKILWDSAHPSPPHYYVQPSSDELANLCRTVAASRRDGYWVCCLSGTVTELTWIVLCIGFVLLLFLSLILSFVGNTTLSMFPQ